MVLTGGANEVAATMALTKTAALAYLMFNLYTPPCFAAIGAMNAEMKSGKWLWGGIGLQLAIGYTVSYFVYTIGTLITEPEALNIGVAVAGLAAVVVMAAIIIALIIKSENALKTEYKLKEAKKQSATVGK